MNNEIGGDIRNHAADDGEGLHAMLKTLADAGSYQPEHPGSAGNGTCAGPSDARAGKVRIHPIPRECPPELAVYVAMCVRGAVTDALNKHGQRLSKSERGMLIGSIGKRAVNQLCCDEGRAKLYEMLALNPRTA